jgi:NAD-dependent dihydropyrimidine dehydrogenase PreA subunit
MGEYSETADSGNSRRSSRQADDPICKVCNGRKYTLIATRKLNQTSVVYDRQICRACAVAEDTPSAEQNSLASQSGKKTLSGTGYLRNKKRRRKEAS